MLLGVHCSVAGGLQNAFTEAKRLGIDTFQIFTRNQRQWHAKPITPEEKQLFSEAGRTYPVKTTFSHCSYLLNAASANPNLVQNTITALTEEVIRCTELGLSFCVMHPGAAGEQTMVTAIKNIAKTLKQVIKNTSGSNVKIALENTAGQGSSVGGPFENLRAIFDETESERIGFCIDTCHAFVKGYDIRTKSGVEETLNLFDKICGLNNLCAFHFNDSKGDLGSHLDRHDNIGEGKLGLEPFRYIMHNFPHVPKVLETPKENDADVKNLAILRGL